MHCPDRAVNRLRNLSYAQPAALAKRANLGVALAGVVAPIGSKLAIDAHRLADQDSAVIGIGLCASVVTHDRCRAHPNDRGNRAQARVTARSAIMAHVFNCNSWNS